MAANVASQGDNATSTAALIPHIPQIVEQLLKLVPSTSGTSKGESDTEEEIDSPFSGMVTCYNVATQLND